jgi:hypothetical protein
MRNELIIFLLVSSIWGSLSIAFPPGKMPPEYVERACQDGAVEIPITESMCEVTWSEQVGCLECGGLCLETPSQPPLNDTQVKNLGLSSIDFHIALDK